MKNDWEKVSQIFRKLGAPEESAQRMAKQLIKRARQLAEQKKSSMPEELSKLLEISVLGAQGRLKDEEMDGFQGKTP